ncbi:hypothetical protein D9C73_003772 [Collichthys lucidus]|uniref:Uncharacterized protein n=1 Tax=Collichthys lucidus TaxID=240159 RepID=A0A4U5U9G0_COLLU|nr:hypothetical protein D9C73_003772 [Collichthys lucidus]
MTYDRDGYNHFGDGVDEVDILPANKITERTLMECDSIVKRIVNKCHIVGTVMQLEISCHIIPLNLLLLLSFLLKASFQRGTYFPAFAIDGLGQSQANCICQDEASGHTAGGLTSNDSNKGKWSWRRETEREKSRKTNKQTNKQNTQRQDAKAFRGDACGSVDVLAAGVDYLCSLRVYDSYHRPVQKYTNWPNSKIARADSDTEKEKEKKKEPLIIDSPKETDTSGRREREKKVFVFVCVCAVGKKKHKLRSSKQAV